MGDGMATAQAAIKVRGVSHQFGEEGERRFVRALADTSLDVARGELMCLIGPSGCGKSTLLNAIGGLMRPSSGSVDVMGKAVAGPLPRDIAFVFQESALFPWNTVIENIELGMTFQGVAKSERSGRASQALEAVGLKDFAQHYPAQLSGGMRQRVCIARTLVMEPKLILLDEPFGALDQQTRLLMGDEVLNLWRATGATIMLITHSLDEAAMLSDRVGVMSARPGRFLEIIETGWDRDRDGSIASTEKFGNLTTHLWSRLRRESIEARHQLEDY
jgi:NitT/TauT family transport system ATP-binding protein